MRKFYVGNSVYKSLDEVGPEVYATAIKRAETAREFAAWAMDEFRRTYDTSGNAS